MNSRIKMGLLIAATIVLLGLAPNLHIVPMLNENQTLYFPQHWHKYLRPYSD